MDIKFFITVLFAFGSLRPIEVKETSTLNNNQTENSHEVSRDVNHFALEIYRTLRRNEGNLIFSSFSMSLSMSMLYFMSGGETAAEIANTARLNTNKTLLGLGFSNLIQNLSQDKSLKFGHRVFVQNGINLKQAYKNNMRKYFKTNIETVDFTNVEEARRQINSQVKADTDGKITELMSYGSISADTSIVLTSSLFFKELWQHGFNSKQKRKQRFQLANGMTRPITMMNTQKKLGYAALEKINATVLQIPYKKNRHNMIILLPNEYDGLPLLEDYVTTTDFTKEILDEIKFTKVKVEIPKFKVEDTIEMKAFLMKLGLRRIFDAELSDFTNGIESERGLEVSSVQHSACLELTEQGTQAGAATGMAVAYRSGFTRKIIPHFTADHPFMFVIIDSKTKLILFAGRFSKPP